MSAQTLFCLRRTRILLVVALLASRPAAAQLFDNLQAFTGRVEVGDPGVVSTWEGGKEGPKGVAAGDLDGDGKPDLAAANLDGTITIRFGLGNGEFGEPTHLRTGAVTLRDILIADLTGDGLPDLIACAPLQSQAFLYVNKGRGSFGAPIVVPTWPYARDLAAGDFRGDGKLDLIVAGSGVGLRQLRFAPPDRFDTAGDLSSPLASYGQSETKLVYSMKPFRPAGANRDELAATNAESDQVCIFAANPEGVLGLQGCVGPVSDIYSLDVGAIRGPSGQARNDLVTAHRDLGVVQVRCGKDGPERFEAAVCQEIQIPGGPRFLRIVDLDGDGWNDLAVVARNLDRVITYRNEGGKLVPSSEMPVGTSPRELAVADFNRDGQPDLAVINRLSGDVSILTAYPGEVGFGALDQEYLVDGGVQDLALRDLDRDGRDDVIQLHRASGDLSVRLSGPGGRLSAPTFYPMGISPGALRLGDVDGDGLADAVTANLGAGPTLGDGSISVRLGTGTGGFAAEERLKVPEQVKGRLFALEMADFDRDGQLDVAAGFMDCRIGFFKNRGDGTFDFAKEALFVYEARAMAAGDFDGDGDVDLAGAGYAGNLVVIENRGDLFTPAALTRQDYPPASPSKFGTQDLKARDVNGDGDLDLVMGSGMGAMVYLGKPGMGFDLSAQELPGTEFPASSLAIADFDGDGDKDIAVSCRILSCITILTLSAGGEYQPALTVKVPAGRLLASGDLDGDGQPDLVGSGEVLWTALSGRRAGISGPAVLSAPRETASGVVINEILAINNRFPFPDLPSQRPDWVELFNGSSQKVDLGGYQVTLAAAGSPPKSYRLPAQASIEPKGHLLLTASSDARFAFPLGFKLPGGGALLSLLDAGGRPVDSVEYPPQRENVSYARYRDGLPAFVSNLYPSPGDANTDNGSIAPLVTLESIAPAGAAPGEPFRALRPSEPIRFSARASDDVGVVSVSLVYRRRDIPDPESHRLILYDDGMHQDGLMQDGLFVGDLEAGLPAGGEIEFALEGVDLEDNKVSVPEGGVSSTGLEGRAVYTLGVGGPRSGLELSELVAINSTGLTDEGGGTPDWVEIRNCSTAPLSLKGFFLGERFAAEEDWFQIPGELSLEAGGHLVIFCDGKPGQGPLHAPFKLSAGGGRLVLVGSLAHGGHVVLDSVDYGPQTVDIAWARTACGGGWSNLRPTPGRDNSPLVDRGDADGNLRLEVTDPVRILTYLYQGDSLPCREAADANSDSTVDITDAIDLFAYLFLGGPAPRPGQVPCN
jgi:hypothetical protein